jgi:hypothetical protein
VQGETQADRRPGRSERGKSAPQQERSSWCAASTSCPTASPAGQAGRGRPLSEPEPRQVAERCFPLEKQRPHNCPMPHNLPAWS